MSHLGFAEGEGSHEDGRAARIRTLFVAALDLPPDARMKFLCAQCGADLELLAEVEARLRVLENESTGDVPKAPVFDLCGFLEAIKGEPADAGEPADTKTGRDKGAGKNAI